MVDPLSPETGNNVLRLVASGPTEHMHNHVETTLRTSVQNGRTYQISYRACWLQGSNQLNTRLYFDRLARTTQLQATPVLGTPGQPNLAQIAAPAPRVFDVRHSPPVPTPGDPVLISADIEVARGYSAEYPLQCYAEVLVAGSPAATVPLVQNLEGRFEATVPALPEGSVVSYRIVATFGQVTSAFPPDSRMSSALYRVGTRASKDELTPVVHIIMLEQVNEWFLAPVNRMSNDRVPCTVIVGTEIFYNVGARGKGSERGRTTDDRLGFGLFFDPSQLLLGAYHSAMLDRSEGQHPGQREWLLNQAFARAGSTTAKYNDLVYVDAPQATHSGHAELQLARYSNTMLDRQFSNGGDGQLYEFELIYYPIITELGTGILPPPPPPPPPPPGSHHWGPPPSGPSGGADGLKLPQPDSVVGAPQLGSLDGSQDKEQYRYIFLAKNNRRADNYGPLLLRLHELDSVYSDDEYVASGVKETIDVNQWLRGFAFAAMSGATDNWGTGNGLTHNAQFFVEPAAGRLLYFPHDLDFFRGGSGTSTLLGGRDVPVVLARLISHPPYMRLFLGHIVDLITSGFEASYFQSWVDVAKTRLPEQTEHLDEAAQYNAERAQSVLEGPGSVTETIPCTPFVAQAWQSDPKTGVLLQGSGWVTVDAVVAQLPSGTVRVSLCWTDESHWVAEIPIDWDNSQAQPAGFDSFHIFAIDRHNSVVGKDEVFLNVQNAVHEDFANRDFIGQCLAALPEPASYTSCNTDPAPSLALCGLVLPAEPMLCATAPSRNDPDGSCGASAFASMAQMVTTLCCQSSNSQSGHRRHLQAACSVPTVCPSASCATSFVAFFDSCEHLLADMPQMPQYAALHADCVAKMGSGTGFNG